MESSPVATTAQTRGRLVTILSIDGGGVRGIIPGTILAFLESKLQMVRKQELQIISIYVVAGTSTGGLVAAMITAPDKNNRPLFPASKIPSFYFEHCPKIFPDFARTFFLNLMGNVLGGPKYDGWHLRGMTKDLLGNIRVSQTLTNVVIPTFDIRRLQPVIFTTKDAKADVSKNALLSDVCLGTSAAPTFLPPHYFETKDSNGKTRTFDLIDGAVAANNPALTAITHISKEMSMGALDGKKLLVLSLGTGVAQSAGPKYKAREAANWGVLGWIYNDGATPLIEAFQDASSDMVDIHLSTLFQLLGNQENYLRIQEDRLIGDAALLDVSTTANLQNLVQLGNGLLKKPVSRVNLDTGMAEPVQGGGTNGEALIRFAKLLSEEKKARSSLISS